MRRRARGRFAVLSAAILLGTIRSHEPNSKMARGTSPSHAFATSPHRSQQPVPRSAGPAARTAMPDFRRATQSATPKPRKKIFPRRATRPRPRPRRLQALRNALGTPALRAELRVSHRSGRRLMAPSKNPHALAPCRTHDCTLRPRPGQSLGRPHGVRAGSQTEAFSRDANRVTEYAFS